MSSTDWLKYGSTILVSFLSGGAMGAILTNWFTNRRNRIPTIEIQQSISCVFAPVISVKPKITFSRGGVESHFENLYIIETQIHNKGNNDYPDFDLKLTLSPFAKIVYLECKGQDTSHEVILKEKIEFASPSMIADLSLTPFNRKNIFHITAYATCEGKQGLTKKDIKYSSKLSANFIAAETVP
ncbi:MAG: hypothetical protein WDN26_05280 [Chitinophagaceae bacterium]